MGSTRRFLSLIVDNNQIPGTKSLRCIDLTRHKFFDTTPPPCRPGSLLLRKKNTATFKMGKISLPKPSINVRAPWMRCFPAVERRVFCVDKLGRGLLLEADTKRMVMLPPLHKPNLEPIALYIPCTDELDDLDGGGGGGTLFVMDRVAIAKPEEADEASSQFEALVYRTPSSSFLSKIWDCDLLPPPPCIHGSMMHGLEISSYAVIKGGSQICVSIKGAGSYCLDTAGYTWSEVGKWVLPFQGKVEYVPELKLWFGFSAKDQHFAAADLSTMDSHESQPQLLDSWKELDLHLPQGWQQIQDPQLVSLGSRRFCIARFLHMGTSNCGSGDELSDQNVTILTGVEVIRAIGFDGKPKLGIIRHKTKSHKSSCGEDTITAVF